MDQEPNQTNESNESSETQNQATTTAKSKQTTNTQKTTPNSTTSNNNSTNTSKPYKSLSIIIPCYNEEAGINHLNQQLAPIIQEIRTKQNLDLEIIFIDDGSKDNTLRLLKKIFGNLPYVKIIPHEVNKNLGEAIRTGFKAATGDLVACMDSDCTYDPKGILDMINEMQNDPNLDILTASPYHKDGGVDGVPKWRLTLSFGISAIYQFLTWSNIKTFTALFRIQKKHIAKNIDFKASDFLATAELVVYPLMMGYKVKEYPCVLHVRKFGQSKMRVAQVAKSHVKFIFKLIGMKLTGKFKEMNFLFFGVYPILFAR